MWIPYGRVYFILYISNIVYGRVYFILYISNIFYVTEGNNIFQ